MFVDIDPIYKRSQKVLTVHGVSGSLNIKPTFLVIISPVRPGLTIPGIVAKVLDRPINILAN